MSWRSHARWALCLLCALGASGCVGVLLGERNDASTQSDTAAGSETNARDVPGDDADDAARTDSPSDGTFDGPIDDASGLDVRLDSRTMDTGGPDTSAGDALVMSDARIDSGIDSGAGGGIDSGVEGGVDGGVDSGVDSPADGAVVGDSGAGTDTAVRPDARPPLSCEPAPTTGFHVSVMGTPGGDGSLARPWDLATALAQPSALVAGSQVWLHGGTYVGAFRATLSGSVSAPITVASYPGEWAILDGVSAPHSSVLEVTGSDVTFRDFEITNTYAPRYLTATGSNPAGARGPGAQTFGRRVRLVNLIIHDTGGPVGTWSGGDDAEVYGCILYYGGWLAPDRGHGHGVYVQNTAGMKRIADNVIFRNFSYGLHGYTEGGRLHHINATGNIGFNSGEISGPTQFTTNFLIGGLQVADSPTLSGNFGYFPSGYGRERLGYSAGCTSATVENNYFVAETALELESCALATYRGNTFYGAVEGAPAGDTMNTYVTTRPTGTRVFLRANEFEAGRAHIAVYNWDRAAAVDADVSAVLSAGQRWQLWDVQDLPAGPIASGTYTGGTIRIPMDHTGVAMPVGTGLPAVPPHTDREFGAFLLRRACP